MTELHTANERWIQEQEHELWPNRTRAEHNHTDCRACGPGPLGRGEVPSQWPHVFYKLEKWDNGYSCGLRHRRTTKPSLAHVVSSEIEGTLPGEHTLMVDIDLPARLVESSTRGHFHLYIDRRMTWRQYKRVLRAMMLAGIIEKGYYKASVKRRATHLRPPWVEK